MSKIRADSVWNQLTPEQRTLLEQWLFDENLGYQQAWELAQKQFGFAGSVSSVVRIYRQLAPKRLVRDLTELKAMARVVNETKVDTASLRGAAMKVIGKRLLESAMGSGKGRDLEALGRLLLESEEHDIRREWLALARERFEYNAAEAALAQVPHLEKMTPEQVRREEERVMAIKHRLFGKNLPE